MRLKGFTLWKTTRVIGYKILGLDLCADTLVGDEMIKGISGGQKKRLATGELLVGPSRVLFMDEISTGLDSATTYHIIKYLRHSTRALEGTTVISLLQPAPETYELFDDLILLSEGKIVYQGPRAVVLEFFASMGFSCPDRKNVADFLQEVISKKDQEQYWASPDRPYRYIPVMSFAEAFSSYSIGKNLSEELDIHLISVTIIQQLYHLLNMGSRRLNFLKPTLTGNYFL
ncbi:UNVERIFIED_CONTAM: ABC transporter G family member 32 [Sesamum calycinum]|uniref:ABC transporter G family member 32 n=1 Tax=Sesamum calycinum TaxID=2727403 RepID=A0AAW2N3Q9_9LAMI